MQNTSSDIFFSGFVPKKEEKVEPPKAKQLERKMTIKP
jgi:hypothetical protein